MLTFNLASLRNVIFLVNCQKLLIEMFFSEILTILMRLPHKCITLAYTGE